MKQIKNTILIVSALLFTAFLPFHIAPGFSQGKSSNSQKKIKLLGTRTIKTGIGVKAVEMSPDGSRIYSINLEVCSVYEFNRASKKLQRKIEFVRHAGQGFNYKTKKKISSYQEKPVEGHFSHNGRFLWISLHNADGIVIWDLLEGSTAVAGKPYKSAWYYEYFKQKTPPTAPKKKSKKYTKKRRWKKKKSAPKNYTKKMIKLRWIKTGATPKVITSSPDGKYLFVANWHSHNVSVLDISSPKPGDWKIIRTLRTGSVPRGMVVSKNSRYLYVAQMGSNYISVVDLNTMKKIDTIKVGVNPRHLVISNGYLYSSLNRSGKIVKIDQKTRQIIRSAKTLPTPRTISISEDGKVIFVVCYNVNQFQVFSADNLTHLGTWPSKTHPVGVTVYQGDTTYEAWVGNYYSGTIKIFTFQR